MAACRPAEFEGGTHAVMFVGAKVLACNREQGTRHAKHGQQQNLFDPQGHAVGRDSHAAKFLERELHDKAGHKHHHHRGASRDQLCCDLLEAVHMRDECIADHALHHIKFEDAGQHEHHHTCLADDRGHRDAVEPHDAELIAYVTPILAAQGVADKFQIMAPREATRASLEIITKGENSIAVTGNVLRIT